MPPKAIDLTLKACKYVQMYIHVYVILGGAETLPRPNKI